MRASQRVLLNTIAQYTRTIINLLLSLYTVRVVLSSLGVSDYGIYTVIAGVVSMLGFVTNSLVETTQRFISYYQGNEQKETLKRVFNNSLIIHIFLGIVVSILLLCFAPLLFNGFLNIPDNRIDVSKIVYIIVVIILFTTFITSPFRALLVSHENIVYISLVDVLDGLLKVFAVTIMAKSTFDRLLFYSFIMLSIQFFNFFALSTYCYLKYEECTRPSLKKLELRYLKELFNFAGWKIFGTLCIVGRQQGMSIVFNRFLGPTINAGFGIGNQLSGYTNFLSSAIVNAMAPQIVKAEGAGNRERSLWLSNILSKLNFFLMSILGIPMIFEVNRILQIWLNDIPEYSNLFCIAFIIGLLFDSLTIGLTHINNAVGRIKKYMLWMGIPKLMTVAIVYYINARGYSLQYSCLAYIIIESFTSIFRIFLIHNQINLNVGKYCKEVILRSIFPVIMCILVCITCRYMIEWEYRFLITFSTSALVYSTCMYYCGFNKSERNIILQLVTNIKNRICRK